MPDKRPKRKRIWEIIYESGEVGELTADDCVIGPSGAAAFMLEGKLQLIVGARAYVTIKPMADA